MKRGLKLIGALSLATVLLYGCDKAGTSTTTSEGTAKEVSHGDLAIAFVYTDSVINKYDYFKTRSEELTEKGKKFEGDLQSRARGFEQEIQNFQQTGGNMTQNQARAKQEELAKKEQNLMTYRDNLMQELSSDESALYSEVYDRVQKYLKKYAEDNNLSVILSYTRGGAVWYGNDALDLTSSVIEGLNKEYTAAPADTAK
ncbi:OmpH family outer membrane protein [Algoriphagus sp. NG3]|uniref:OmpH family outer membrane protein n=1 Tax=unclassified Algoriphagus TaxID=2641541 RepID=UPI002A833122|nr:OmpH family outer membrane protein [Algoriphagus sp. NG3]WPR76998.1 OmpH family outer membrane protein [Algoriphagus sp. NG3]